MTEEELFKKLLKIEALYSGATTDGEKLSALNAKKRILKRIEESKPIDPPIEYKFTLQSIWNVKIFVALLDRYNIKAYRRPRQRRTTVMAKVSVSFVETVLWPEYVEIQNEVDNYFSAKVDNIVIELMNKKGL